MNASYIRIITTSLVALGAIGVSFHWGDTTTGKLVSTVAALVLAIAAEFVLRWTPRHSTHARRWLGQPGYLFEGVWVQDVERAQNLSRDSSWVNRFAVMSIVYRDGRYDIDGRAYSPVGAEGASWHCSEAVGRDSQPPPTLSPAGRTMNYLWAGNSGTPGERSEWRPSEGSTTLDIEGSGAEARGRMRILGHARELHFDLRRVSPALLADVGFDASGIPVEGLVTNEQFAAALARWFCGRDERQPA
jgi:hypothetical protein